MDTFRSNHDREQDLESDYAIQANDWPSTPPVQSKSAAPGFGFNLLKALRQNGQAVPTSTEAVSSQNEAANFAGFVNTPAKAYVEPTPLYRGHYDNLSPLYFNTEPVDNANDTRLERAKLTSYTRAQLFFLLRLERFLRLRHHWQKASPRLDESWKTNLVMRSIYSALQDCIKHEVGEDGRTLLAKWGCC